MAEFKKYSTTTIASQTRLHGEKHNIQCACNMSKAQTLTDDSEWMRSNCGIDGL